MRVKERGRKEDGRREGGWTEGGEDGRREGRLEGERRGEKEGVGEKKEGRERWREKGREGEYKSFNICCKCSCAGALNSKSYKKVLQFSILCRFYVNKNKSS